MFWVETKIGPKTCRNASYSGQVVTRNTWIISRPSRESAVVYVLFPIFFGKLSHLFASRFPLFLWIFSRFPNSRCCGAGSHVSLIQDPCTPQCTKFSYRTWSLVARTNLEQSLFTLQKRFFLHLKTRFHYVSRPVGGFRSPKTLKLNTKRITWASQHN